MANVQHKDLVGADLHITQVHAASHAAGELDELALDALGAASDNTDLDVTGAAHGLCPKLPSDATQFLDGEGAWAIPGGAPTGAMVMWMTETAPSGWLECRGQSLLRSSYAALFGVLGVMYGHVDGTHFTLPDMRAFFIRGWDHARGGDPDVATRGARQDGAEGDHVGTDQYDEFKSHTHGDIWKWYPAGGYALDAVGGNRIKQDDLTTASGGSESRPINIAVMFIMKT